MDVDSVRGRSSDDAPTARWRPRVEGRWTVVYAFSAGGRRYFVARENEVQAPGLDQLTTREQEVVTGAAAGLSSKEIAYDLGISAVTVRVLMMRACERLGVRDRTQLLQLPCVRDLRGEGPAITIKPHRRQGWRGTVK